MRMPSMTLEQGLDAAIQLQQANKLEEAERLYRQILAQHPDCADALHLLGVVCAQMGRHNEALELIRKAISLHPTIANFHVNLANVLFNSGNAEEAARAFADAVNLNSKNVESYLGLGIALKKLSRLDEAAEAFQRALKIDSNSGMALHYLGHVLQKQGNQHQAIEMYRRAIEVQPGYAMSHSGLANIFSASGRSGEAIAEYQKAIALRPDMPELYNDLALALGDRGRFDEALTAINKAMELRPDWAIAYNNRAKILRDQGRLEEAIAAVRRALLIAPHLAEAHINLAGTLLDSGEIDAALISIKRALELAPESAVAHNLLANVLKEAGDVPGAIAAFDRVIALQPDNAAFHSNKVYLLEFDPRCDARALLDEQRRWDERYAQPLKKLIRPHENDRTVERRLRIGYVSPYLRDHSESFFVVPLLESHDRTNFEIHCFSDSDYSDAVTERMKRCTDRWHATAGLGAQELAERIRGQRIDILVDLAMHMAFNRALMFAQKPAPIQVAWLAYPGGTGLEAMDYRITDPWIDPVDGDDSCYREESVRLPNTWVCFDPLENVPPAAQRKDGPICFGSINNPCKLNEMVLDLWAGVLNAVPTSILLLQSLSVFQRARIVQFLQSRGIAVTRLQFVSRSQRSDYRKLYDRIDICLDPLPYNGITTTCDALWMGVPVISLAGQTAAGRAASSILENVGMSELVANNAVDFVRIASKLAIDFPRLAKMRETLRDRMRQSPLCDAKSFARDLEKAYRMMWRRWCERT